MLVEYDEAVFLCAHNNVFCVLDENTKNATWPMEELVGIILNRGMIMRWIAEAFTEAENPTSTWSVERSFWEKLLVGTYVLVYSSSL